MKENILIDKSIMFAARIVKLHNHLIKTKKEHVISKQIIRSGTSIGANINEASYGQSKADFISKMHIALKETAETEYWLKLLVMSDYLSVGLYHHNVLASEISLVNTAWAYPYVAVCILYRKISACRGSHSVVIKTVHYLDYLISRVQHFKIHILPFLPTSVILGAKFGFIFPRLRQCGFEPH